MRIERLFAGFDGAGMRDDDFDEQLDLGTRELAEELHAMEQESMRYVADTFAAALAADLITAADFQL